MEFFNLEKNCKILEMSLYRFSGYLVLKKIFFPLNPFFEFPAPLTTVPVLVHSLLCVLNIKGLTGHGDAVLVAVITVFIILKLSLMMFLGS